MPDDLRKGEVIETTVDKVAAELVRRGLDPHDRVVITIESDKLVPGRRAARARVIAAGLTDEDYQPADRRSPYRGATAAWMRVVSDTNVFISAALKENAAGDGGSSRGSNPRSPQIHSHRAK